MGERRGEAVAMGGRLAIGEEAVKYFILQSGVPWVFRHKFRFERIWCAQSGRLRAVARRDWLRRFFAFTGVPRVFWERVRNSHEINELVGLSPAMSAEVLELREVSWGG